MSAIEIITRRRKWKPEEKASLLAEIEAEGGRVSVVARRHGLSESLLYNWRSAWKAVSSSSKPEPVVEFVPLGVIDRTSDARPALLTAPEPAAPPKRSREERAGKIEIELPSGVRVRIDALVSEKMLSRVFRVLKGAV
jgi:transposase